MIKKTAILLSLIFAVCTCLVIIGAANATVYPDIVFNNDGYIEYDADTQILHLHAMDLKIVYPWMVWDPIEGEWVNDADSMYVNLGIQQGRIPIEINILVDNAGNFIGDAPGYEGDADDMTETITWEQNLEFEFMDLDKNNWNAADDWKVDDVLLNGDVMSFSYDFSGDEPQFTFIIDPYEGLFLDRNIFPDYPIQINVSPDEGFDSGEGWEDGFRVEKAKGDKFPTPEPGTMLLLGLGLLGLVGISRRKRG